MESAEPLPPRMTERDIGLVKHYGSGKGTCIEFGCGGSTLLLLKEIRGRLLSVESDPKWIERLRQRADIGKYISEGKLLLVHADIGPVGELGRPNTDQYFRKWPNYYAKNWQALGSLYDFILVDGRFRTMCALSAINFLASDAIVLVHDYQFRHDYSLIMKYYEEIQRGDEIIVCKVREKVDRTSLYFDMMDNINNAN
jgi:hypothetical protein